MKKTLLLISILVLATCCTRPAKVELPAIFGDNMVLQQKSQAGIWGWTKPGKEVRVEASWGESVSTKADVTGKWKVLINTPEASFEKITITISDRQQPLITEDDKNERHFRKSCCK